MQEDPNSDLLHSGAAGAISASGKPHKLSLGLTGLPTSQMEPESVRDPVSENRVERAQGRQPN